MWFIYKSIAKFLLMDLELSGQVSALPCLFAPIEQFSPSALYQQPIQLENSFSLTANNLQPHFLMTLIGSTLLYSPLVDKRLEPTGGLVLGFDLKFQVIYQVQRNVRSPKRGLRLFFDQSRSMSLFASPAVIEAWTICLSQQLNQLGFHEMFKPLKKLGKGNFASVYQVERLTDGRRFAVKAFSKQNCFSAKNGKQSLINQLSIMRALSTETHTNLLKLESVFESENSIYVVLELITGGQLFHRIQERNGYFSAEEVKEFMLGLLRGLKRMHEERIMHRDLKPENIMMRGSASMTPIIVDYGLATHADVQKYLFFRCGTPGYVAPEIIELTESRHIEPQCDIFSAGVIFHILLTRRPLFQGSKYEQVYRKNKEMKFNLTGEAYKDIDPSAIDLLKSMLLANPQERVTASSALSHAYFSDLNISEQKVSSPVATCASTRRRIFN